MFLGAGYINWLDAWFSTRDLRLIEEFPALIKKGRTSLGLKTFIMVARGFALEQDLDKVRVALDTNDPFTFYRWSAFEKAPTALFEFVKEFVDEPALFDSIGKAFELFSVLSMKSLLAAVAVQLLCLRSYRDDYVIDPCSKGEELLERHDGLKNNRVYKIVGSMLPCRHKRATQWEVLCKSHKEIITGAGSRFWSDVAASISDDDVFEQVTEELFPEDCPDEWSIADRAVSHPDKFVKYKQYIRPTYRCKLLWGFVPVLRIEWFPALDTLFKACLAPEN
jgi:hypothetical protein